MESPNPPEGNPPISSLLPKGWIATTLYADANYVYFYNNLLQKSQWEKPEVSIIVLFDRYLSQLLLLI